MEKKHLLHFLYFLFSIISCRSQNNEVRYNKIENINEIVLIFDNIPMYKTKIDISYRFSVQNTEPLISYWDGYSKKTISPKENDTITINPKCEFIFLRHNFNTLSNMDFIIKKRGHYNLFL